ncbi:hypothetical protein Tsubulata_016155 [Turnera subulata]|uniref:DUF4283 domain-containing protein n=1 Tax=Turnera subulata TaxID=218843 RepID=A0A9Q0GJH6_9ROSI|nr:hypothetical protein Tsubulata_016155 [Turnera subulata]
MAYDFHAISIEYRGRELRISGSSVTMSSSQVLAQANEGGDPSEGQPEEQQTDQRGADDGLVIIEDISDVEEISLSRSLFYDDRDIERVLDGEPWHFDKHVLALQETVGDEQFSSINPTTTPIWVYIYDIPPRLRSVQVVQTLAGRIGEFMEIEMETLSPRSNSVKDCDEAPLVRDESEVTVFGDFLWASPPAKPVSLSVAARKHAPQNVRRSLFTKDSSLRGVQNGEGRREEEVP